MARMEFPFVRHASERENGHEITRGPKIGSKLGQSLFDLSQTWPQQVSLFFNNRMEFSIGEIQWGWLFWFSFSAAAVSIWVLHSIIMAGPQPDSGDRFVGPSIQALIGREITQALLDWNRSCTFGGKIMRKFAIVLAAFAAIGIAMPLSTSGAGAQGTVVVKTDRDNDHDRGLHRGWRHHKKVVIIKKRRHRDHDHD